MLLPSVELPCFDRLLVGRLRRHSLNDVSPSPTLLGLPHTEAGADTISRAQPSLQVMPSCSPAFLWVSIRSRFERLDRAVGVAALWTKSSSCVSTTMSGSPRPSRKFECLWGRWLSPARDTAWAMSEENVEIVRRLIDAWNRQDIEGMLALIDPEAEYVNAPTAVEPGTRRGHDAIVAVG